MRSANTTMETISAAATAISSAEQRAPPSPSSSFQKRRWGSFWSISSCFGSHKRNTKKIRHAVLLSEPSSSTREAPTTENISQSSTIVLPFMAPPSSPASFLQSEPPSATQSPGGLLSFTATSSGFYSPSDPNNMFAVGPYAHERQLVSPPVFSTYTTEPSTAPFTPPPESVQLTTPSSPEVPFARFFGSGKGEVHRKMSSSSQNEFQLFQLHPGSPIGNLISPSSGVSNSGNSSPFPDYFPPVLQSPTGAKLWPRGSVSQQESGTTTPDPAAILDRQNSDLGPLTSFLNDDQHMVHHRVSFEITPEEVERRLIGDVANGRDSFSDDVSRGGHRSTATFGSVKEFNFDSTDGDGGGGGEADSGTCGVAGEKVLGKEPMKNWAFFPIIQPGVS